jgi:ice-binding like protein/putative surface cell wall-binding protein
VGATGPTPRRRQRGCRPALLLTLVLTGAVLLPLQSARAAVGAPVNLRSAAAFAVLAGSTVTNAGDTMVNGDLGVSPGTAATITPGMVNGTIHGGDPVAAAAQADLATAYNTALAQGPDAPLVGDLGGLTLGPGLYGFGAAATLATTLTLDGGGDPDAVFIFQIGSTITTAANSSVVLTGGAQACHVSWLIGSSATLGANTSLRGDVLAITSITAVAGTTVEGRLLAMNGAVTLDTNTVTATTCLPPVTTTTSTTTPTTTSTTGPLSITAAPAGDFAGRTVTGTAQTTTAVLEAFSVTDPRGSGAGWHVTAHATTFTGSTLHQLAVGSLSMSAPTVSPVGTASALPTVVAGPYTIDDTSPVSIASAADGAGMGSYLFAATTLTLALPADAYADVYTSTITVSVVSAP